MVADPRDAPSELGGGPPIGLAAFDGKLRYVAVNAFQAELNGISAEAHVGKTLREIVPELADQLEPLLRATFDGGEPIYGVPVSMTNKTLGETRFTEVSMVGLDGPDGRRQVVGCVIVDTTRRDRAVARAAALQDAITVVAASSDARAAAAALAERVVHAVGAQGATISFATEDDHLEFIAGAGHFGRLIRERWTKFPLSARVPARDAYVEGRTVWIPTQRAWQERYPDAMHLTAHGARAVLVAPLQATFSGRRLGVLGVTFDHEPQLEPDDLAVVTAFAQHAAQVLERIVLHDSERNARERFELLATLGARLDEELEPVDRVDAFLDTVVPWFAESAHVELLDDDDVWLSEQRGTNASEPLQRITVPLVARGSVFGTVTLSRTLFTPNDHTLAIELCRRLANALDNARLYARERNLAETLQLSLLPRRVPKVPGAQVWARYLPGTDLVVGGDFWDVIELPSQRLLLVVGDVAGRGEPAAVVMGRLRTVIRATTEADTTPAALISALNRFLVDHEDEMATCLCAILDQTTGVVRVANAGHPPLLRVRADGSTEYLGHATGLPLGVRPFATYREECFEVSADETIVLFTDGLVERRGISIDTRLELLAARASEAIAEGEGWCDRIVETMIGARRDDDVALLGVRIEHWRTPELEIEVPAELVHLRSVRDRVRAWLLAQPVPIDDIEALLLSVGEATGNVAVHAYGAAGGQLRLRAVITGDHVEFTVADDGRWRPPRDDEGRGLRIIEQLNDSVAVDASEDGTTVTFRRRLSLR